MRGKDKPFVMYRRGPLSFTIVPRGLKGWLQFALWMAIAAALVYWFAGHAWPEPPRAAQADSASFAAALFLFCMGMLAWLVGGLWWTLAHAEVVDVAVMQRDRQRQRRKQQHDT